MLDVGWNHNCCFFVKQAHSARLTSPLLQRWPAEWFKACVAQPSVRVARFCDVAGSTSLYAFEPV